MLRPTPYHRSRLHTLRGTTMSPREWLDLPVQIGRRLTGRERTVPWLSQSTLRRLDRILFAEARMVEVGAGSSTPWLARRVAELTSFEPDEEWRARVRDTLESQAITNVSLDGGTFDQIGAAVRALEDSAYDFFLVDTGDDQGDGPGRVDFVEIASSKVKPGGYVVLDNSDRPSYAGVDDLLRGWQIERCVGTLVRPLTVTETSFYRRPARG